TAGPHQPQHHRHRHHRLTPFIRRRTLSIAASPHGITLVLSEERRSTFITDSRALQDSPREM
ncbi:MAG: hypothetical protein OSA88_13460, partial [Acidimicrobiales bacterium]|nr:hypothetical protein [Acidimicrobiales bacterium]